VQSVPDTLSVSMQLLKVVLAVAESGLEEGEELLSRVTARQISYFADADGLSGLLHHLHGNP
jgi:hypothetical protein